MNNRDSEIFNKKRNMHIANQKEPDEQDKLKEGVRTNKKGSTIGFLKFHGFGISEIIPRLFLGGQDVATNLQTLQKYQITHIINLTSNIENLFEKYFIYNRVKMNDSNEQNILVYLNELVEFIDNALNYQEGSEVTKNSVLVHCNAGVNILK
jgi:hypothetical protein